MKAFVRIASFALCALLAGVPLVGQHEPGRSQVHRPKLFPYGEIVERVQSRSDTNQHYALYVPSSYSPDRDWPTLIVMDPRGRALVPLRRLYGAAERLGYLVISSYNTLSDGPADPNERAIRAMVADVQRLFSVDIHRFYLIGFSGTARAAWDFAYRLRGNVAGIVGFGGGIPLGLPLADLVRRQGTPFVFFGGAGTADFNYDEMRALGNVLDGFGFSHRFQAFDGPHSWPPDSVFTEAIAWIELQAIKRGLRVGNPEWIDRHLAMRMERAGSLEAAGDTVAAFDHYRALADDLAGLRNIAGIEARVHDLRRSKLVQRSHKQIEKHTQHFGEYAQRLGRQFSRIRAAASAPSARVLAKRLEISDLRRRIERSDDTADVLAATRLLELAFVHASFYEPRIFFEQGEPAKALAMLEVANAIKPDHPRTCYGLVRARMQLGDVAEAVRALECYVRATSADAGDVENDPNFAALRNELQFQQLLDRMRR